MKSNLFTTWYREDRQQRRGELDICIALNAMAFDRLYILAERAKGTVPANAEMRQSLDRQTYAAMIDYAQVADDNDITIIANCDIIIPTDALITIERTLTPDTVYCLSRYEIMPGGGEKLFDVEYSQDLWAFRGKPRAVGGDYFFGVPGVDNRFAHELKQAGYNIANPSKSIKTYHLHTSQQRTETNRRPFRVPPPYLFVEPHELGETPVESVRGAAGGMQSTEAAEASPTGAVEVNSAARLAQLARTS